MLTRLSMAYRSVISARTAFSLPRIGARRTRSVHLEMRYRRPCARCRSRGGLCGPSSRRRPGQCRVKHGDEGSGAVLLDHGSVSFDLVVGTGAKPAALARQAAMAMRQALSGLPLHQQLHDIGDVFHRLQLATSSMTRSRALVSSLLAANGTQERNFSGDVVIAHRLCGMAFDAVHALGNRGNRHARSRPECLVQ